jgi:hypothetical protein
MQPVRDLTRVAPVNGQQRGGERFGRQVCGHLGVGRSPPRVHEHRIAMAPEQLAECLRLPARVATSNFASVRRKTILTTCSSRDRAAV